MKDLLNQIKRLRVLVVGDVMLDRYVIGEVHRISPEAPVPVVELKKEEDRLGGAANVALNIISLGAEVVLASVIGSDVYGQRIIELCSENKIDSRTILGEQGAEQLLGMGDMLYMAGGGKIIRVHAPFVSDEEVDAKRL